MQITLELRVDPSQPERRVRARPHLSARVRPDGSFAFLGRAAPGVWNLTVSAESFGVPHVIVNGVPVVLEGDREVLFGEAVKILSLAQKAGAAQVAIAAQRSRSSE